MLVEYFTSTFAIVRSVLRVLVDKPTVGQCLVNEQLAVEVAKKTSETSLLPDGCGITKAKRGT